VDEPDEYTVSFWREGVPHREEDGWLRFNTLTASGTPIRLSFTLDDLARDRFERNTYLTPGFGTTLMENPYMILPATDFAIPSGNCMISVEVKGPNKND